MAAAIFGSGQPELGPSHPRSSLGVVAGAQAIEILVVDPDPGTATAVTAALDGARVHHVSDTYSALHDVETRRFDVIVMELRLPGASALEFLERLRASGRRVPVVVLSHSRGSPDALRALGVYAILAKPTSSEVLEETLRDAMKIPSGPGTS